MALPKRKGQPHVRHRRRLPRHGHRRGRRGHLERDHLPGGVQIRLPRKRGRDSKESRRSEKSGSSKHS